MATDPRKLRPSELCRLLNSTPLGEVISERQLQRQRTRAGLRIGDGKHVDLVRYVAWLVEQRHKPKAKTDGVAEAIVQLEDAALGAAALASANPSLAGDSQAISGKKELLIAALLTESSHAAAADRAGVSRATVYRWLHLPEFRTAYRQARRELLELAVGRAQAASGQAVDALVTITRQGRRDSDRVRAATIILDRAIRGLTEADILHGDLANEEPDPLDTTGLVRLVANRLKQLDQAELPTAEKARLTATLADSLLKAISVDVLEKRLEAIHNVLLDRKEQK